jgi:hypothetical protein
MRTDKPLRTGSGRITPSIGSLGITGSLKTTGIGSKLGLKPKSIIGNVRKGKSQFALM